jgi:uncharacterized protein (UPF0276 family)
MMQDPQEENVFGEYDGSTYSATLREQAGRYYCRNLVIDGHNTPVTNDGWASREEAMQALGEIASGVRKP